MRLAALVLFAGLAVFAPSALAQANKPAKPVDLVRPTSTGAVPQDTLDDFISGFNGDKDAMDRAMKATSQILTNDPNNVEALAWNSSGKGMLCGLAFQSGDIKKGMQLWKESNEGLNRSVELAPTNTTVRMVRGKSMLEGSLHDPNPFTSNQSATTAIADLEEAIKLMGDGFDKSPQSFKQEMYAWLYQAAAKAGDKERAERYKKLAGEKAGDALDRLNESSANTIGESVRAALIILESPLVLEIKDDLTSGLRSPAKLDAVIATLGKKVDAKPDDAGAMAWRGFARILRSQSMFSQGRVEEGTRAWEKGLNEINAAAATDATTRDALVLRAMSSIELARHAGEPEKRADARQKALTDLNRFERALKDADVTLSQRALATLQLTNARIQLMSGDAAKARALLAAAAKADPTPDTESRTKALLQVADLIEQK